jgi:hypothetical protein
MKNIILVLLIFFFSENTLYSQLRTNENVQLVCDINKSTNNYSSTDYKDTNSFQKNFNINLLSYKFYNKCEMCPRVYIDSVNKKKIEVIMKQVILFDEISIGDKINKNFISSRPTNINGQVTRFIYDNKSNEITYKIYNLDKENIDEYFYNIERVIKSPTGQDSKQDKHFQYLEDNGFFSKGFLGKCKKV